MSKTISKVIILSCGTGEGHNSAAKAIQAVLYEKGITSDIIDVLTFKSETASERVAKLYNFAIKKTPKLFGVIYTLGKWYDDLRLPSPIYRANAKYSEKLYGYIVGKNYDCVICTHFFAMLAMTAVRRKYGLATKCYGILTDYTIHPFLKDSDIDGYFVPNETVAKQFIKKGYKVDKIFITGIPVHPKFNISFTKQEAREILKLPTEKKIIAVMTGGAGCGKVVKLCRKLNGAFDGSYTFMVLTGHNGELYERLFKLFGENGKFKALPFTGDAHKYLKAADAVLSKSGGLSSTEAAVANVPLIHLKAIPGLETANLKYFARNGLSLRADTVGQAVKRIKQILSDDAFTENMLAKQKLLIKAHAAESIALIVTGDEPNEYI